jgi:DNA-binding MarR family transcriptional regulator
VTRDHQFDFDFPDEHRREEATSTGGGGRAGGGGNAAAGPDTNDRDRERDDRDRREIPGLSNTEQMTLRAVGAFRMVDGQHLPKRSVDNLVRHGLAERATGYVRMDEPKREVVVLTKKGRKLAQKHRPDGSKQRYYSGLVKPRELRHDLAMYPLFNKEAQAIKERGGRIQRVVLDYEMKGYMAKHMNAPVPGHVGEYRGVDEETKAARREEVARELELPIVDGHLKIPDVRVEYEDEHGVEHKLDLEIMTEQYRGKGRIAKHQSGFKMSGINKQANGPRGKVRDDHHHNFC